MNVASYDLFSRMISQTCLICPGRRPVLEIVRPFWTEGVDAADVAASPPVTSAAATSVVAERFFHLLVDVRIPMVVFVVAVTGLHQRCVSNLR